jgi:hypothetical protein
MQGRFAGEIHMGVCMGDMHGRFSGEIYRGDTHGRYTGEIQGRYLKPI